MSDVTSSEPELGTVKLAVPKEGNNKIDRKFLQSLSLRSIIKRKNPQLYSLPKASHLEITEGSIVICYDDFKYSFAPFQRIKTTHTWVTVLKNFQNHRWKSPKKFNFSIELEPAISLMCYISDEEFPWIIATQICKHLNTVHDFQIGYCTIGSLVNNISHEMIHLKHLDLPNLAGDVTDENLEFLGCVIPQNLIHLESLVIHFKRGRNDLTGLCNQSLGTLAARLYRDMRKLKYLYLQFWAIDGEAKGWHIGQQWYKIFRYMDSSLKSRLEKASFEISSRNDNLLFDITKSPQNFKYRFSRDYPIEDPEMVKFLEHVNFSSMINLRRLSMTIRECQNITDEGMSLFITMLGKSLNQLDYLHLYFYSCVKIKDKTLNSASESLISELKNVPKMNLRFSSCPWITEKEIKVFLSSITLSTMVQQEIKLSFTSCYRVALEAKDELYCIASAIKGLELRISQ